MDNKEIDKEYVIITYMDFSDLVDKNGLPIHTHMNKSNTIFTNMLKLHDIYSYSVFLYYYSPTIVKTALFLLKIL